MSMNRVKLGLTGPALNDAPGAPPVTPASPARRPRVLARTDAACIQTKLLVTARLANPGASGCRRRAALAQLVEHIIRNDGVTGSNPVSGTTFSQGKSDAINGKAFRLGAGLGPVWGTLARELRTAH